MRQRGLPVPPGFELEDLPNPPPGAGTVPRTGTTTFSRSFSLGTGVGLTGSSSYTDEQGSVKVRNEGGRKFATIKDAQGEVLFDDEITTPEQLKAVPETLRPRIALVDGPAALPGFRRPAAPAPAADAKESPSSEPAKPGPAPKSRKPIDPREGA